MKLRMIGIATLALMVLGTGVFAQGPRAGGRMGNRGPGMGRQVNGLGLSQAQKDQIKTIVQRFHQDVKGVVQSSASKDEKQSQVKALRQKAGEDIMAVLTPEQQAKATQTKFVDRILSPRAAMAARFMRVLGQLNLTEAQKTQVKDIMKGNRDACAAVRNDTSLTPEARRAKMQQVRTDTLDKIKAILTSEQLTKFNELMAQRPGRGAGK
ncbi:MAG: hypothetical protein M1133_13485 [Armatimonadetes bacterium]|nr:hypothetical protein [Armatimonadota bacterium]